MFRVDDGTGVVVDTAADLAAASGEQVIDVAGRVLLPAAAEPHVHLDKAGTVDRAPNPDGDLMGAVRAWLSVAPTLEVDDLRARVTAAVDDYLAAGVTAVRTHVNLHHTIDPLVLTTMLEVRAAVADRCDLQVVGLFMAPLTGDDPAAAANRRLLDEAVHVGIDAVGGAPATSSDPVAMVDLLTATAAEHGLMVDLHVDETLDPASPVLAAYVEDRGAPRPRGPGHRRALRQPLHARCRGPSGDGGAGGRGRHRGGGAAHHQPLAPGPRAPDGHAPAPSPRSVPCSTPGPPSATGADNVEDPFCPLGRADPLDAARLLALTAHLSPAEAWAAASAGSRSVLGLAPAGLTVGSVADLLVVPGTDVGRALARGPAERLVLRRGPGRGPHHRHPHTLTVRWRTEPKVRHRVGRNRCARPLVLERPAGPDRSRS